MCQAKILVRGACGQIGTELVLALWKKYGRDHVIASDIHLGNKHFSREGLYIKADVMNSSMLNRIVKQYRITRIFHLAAVLSATGEQNPVRAWDLNMPGLLSVLEAAKKNSCKVFWPSSIAVLVYGYNERRTG